MTTHAGDLDHALDKIARIIGSPSQPERAPYSGKQPPPPVIQPVPHTDPSDLKGEIARHVYYSMQVPPITTDRLQELEADIPELVKFLSTLEAQPSLRAEIIGQVDHVRRQMDSGQRSGEDHRLAMLIQQMSADAFGVTDERIAPAVGVAIIGAAVVALGVGYTMGKDWVKAK